MAANTISQLTTANTFQHWLTATQSLIGTANTLTNGNGNTFYANTRLEVGGTNATLNVVTSAFINTLYTNTISTGALSLTGNIPNANVTDTLKVGNDAVIYDRLTVYGIATMNTDLEVVGNATITGDLNVTGNINLDSIGFDDLNVSGSGAEKFLTQCFLQLISTLNIIPHKKEKDNYSNDACYDGYAAFFIFIPIEEENERYYAQKGNHCFF